MADIAYIGLGLMGRGMVRNLLKAGHRVQAWNRSAVELPEEITAHPGFARAASVAEAAAGRDRVMLCVTGPDAQRAVLLGPDGVFVHAAKGAVVVDSTTTDPAVSRNLAEAASQAGHAYLDAPVYGSKDQAWDGSIGFIVGGDAAVLQAVRPILEAVSGGVHHLGPNGAGAVMKLIGNLLSAAQTAALGEGLALARKNGLAAEGIIEVLDRFGGSSGVIRGAARKTLANDFSPAFHLKNMAKDIGLMLDLGRASGVPMPGTALTAELYRAALVAGYGELQANAVHKLQFRLAGIEE
ncbi:NAD(P)-dependent oxidoreductase [Inquilinus sp. Marseille-Q2685]|uniref:NAD(P)-dependent oxidoreductase n=1 Tax=Inquilinus sp. Marseille-Q2685 TaxID=2866581 RepID=UPI001CE4A61B|nr:NAD(P)-dependent oxidoreductase [Inquilinus sp. Marseille-Q2685]